MTEETFWTTKRTGELDAKLDPKLTAQRQAFGAGQGGRKLTYLEGHAAIAQLNRLFGYGGWSYSVDEMGVDEYTQGPPEGWYAGFFAVVTLRVAGVSRQDVGCAEVQNSLRGGTLRDNVHDVDSRSTGRKGAVTDALKRAARTFGQQLGNGLYDVDDDVYAWMTAHSLDEGEAGAPAPSPTAKVTAARSQAGAPVVASAKPTTQAVPARKPEPEPQPADEGDAPLPRSAADWTRAQLRERIQEMAGFDLSSGKEWKALAHTHSQPDVASSAEMTQAWLLGLYQAMRTQEYAEAIAGAGTDQSVVDLVAEALSLRDRRQITAQQYGNLSAAGEARKAELGAPLLAGGGGQGRAQVAS